MENLIRNACGLDVHQASITACIIHQEKGKQIKTFGTTTLELEELTKWLVENEVKQLAMESTGVYWKPVFNILSEHFQVLLVNARHIKNVPGKKTDVLDCEWISKLLRAGLLKGSFIPEEQIRHLRNLTRYQKQLQYQIQGEKNRVHKLLEEANIKLTNVLSDIFGSAGSKILSDLSKGITDPLKLVMHLDHDKRLFNKKAQGEQALKGRFKTHHQFMLKKMLEHISFLEIQIKQLEQEGEEIIKEYQQDYERLQTIPGIKEKAAKVILAELGNNMKEFATAKHLTSWSGLCPGNNESAGKKKAAGLPRAING